MPGSETGGGPAALSWRCESSARRTGVRPVNGGRHIRGGAELRSSAASAWAI